MLGAPQTVPADVPPVGVPAPFASAPEAVEEVRNGRFVVLVDSPDPNARCSLAIAGEHASPAAVNFLVTHARGLLFLCLTEERCRELGLTPMAGAGAAGETRLTVSIEAREGVTTGVSAADRSRTFRTAADPATRAVDLIRPGHVFPLETCSGGVLERAERAEAAVDLARLAGLQPAGVVCDVMNADGTLAGLPELVSFAGRFGLKLMSVLDLVEHRRATETLLERGAETTLRTSYGHFRAIAYHELLTGREHIALVRPRVPPKTEVLVATHSECLLCDVFRSTTCSCGQDVDRALARLAAEPHGVLVYARGGPGAARIRAQAADGEDSDWVVAQILTDLGVSRIRLLDEGRSRLPRLGRYGLTVVDEVPTLHVAREPVPAAG